jgi:hypothetical protein
LYGDIDLKSLEKFKDSVYVSGTNAMCWFKFDDGRILFKKYDDELSAYGEVLYSKVASKYGINCAKYDFATYKEYTGTISYDIAFGEHKIAIDGVTLFARYNPTHLPDIINRSTSNLGVMVMFNKKYNNYQELTKLFETRYPDDVETLKEEVIKTFILDVLFDHVDKNLWNIMIVTDEYGKNAHFFSIDSSHIARLNEGKEYIKSAVNSLLTSDGTVTIEDYLSGGVYGYNVDSKDREYNPLKDIIDFYYNLTDSQREEITQFVKEMDISDVIEEINKVKRMDSVVNTWISAVFNARKSFILKKFYHINDNYKGEHVNKNFHLRKIR